MLRASEEFAISPCCSHMSPSGKTLRCQINTIKSLKSSAHVIFDSRINFPRVSMLEACMQRRIHCSLNQMVKAGYLVPGPLTDLR